MNDDLPTLRHARQLVFFMAAAGVAVIVIIAALALVMLQSRDQSRENQRHIDCIIALRNVVTPEGCEAVERQLERDGIYPAPTLPPR